MSNIPQLRDEELKQLMLDAKSIAVVGLKKDPAKASYTVSEYIQSQGYQLIPINPTEKEVLGRKALSSLQVVDHPVDIVVVFRRSEAIASVVEDVLKMQTLPRCVWLQLGIRNDEAVRPLVDKGVQVVQDQCFKIEHFRLLSHVNV